MRGEQSAGRDDAVLPQMPGQQWCQAVITARSAQCGFRQVACRRKTANSWRSTRFRLHGDVAVREQR